MRIRTLLALAIPAILITSCRYSTPHQGGLYPDARFGSEEEMRYEQEMADVEEMSNRQNASYIDDETRKAIDQAVQDMEE